VAECKPIVGNLPANPKADFVFFAIPFRKNHPIELFLHLLADPLGAVARLAGSF